MNNHLGFTILGDTGGTSGHGGGDLKTSEKRRHKQPFRVYHFRGHGGDLGTWGGLRNFRAGRIMLLRNINNHLGFTI